MKSVEIINLTDEQFEMYLELLIEIENKFQEGSMIADNDWSEYQIDYQKINFIPEEFKKDKLSKIEERKKNSLKEFVFFENEKPTGWIALKRISGERYNFICDSLYEKFPEALFEVIKETVFKYLKEAGIDNISFWTRDDRKKEAFKNEGIEIFHEALLSKLYRKDMDIKKLKDIVSENKFIKNYELKLLHEFPEELLENFTEIMKDVNQESQLFNPQKKKRKEYTKVDLLGIINADIEDGDPMYMYVLFDKNKIAAFCRVYIERDSESYFIQHCGGLTGVGKNYRGKGFAKYLKAKMYMKIIEDYPDFEFALTDTYPWNKYMYRINEEMGFKPHRKEYAFGFTKEHLEKLLNRS
ncbi:MAG: GNAT family N-acetyltransferase [Bacteroidota bacterium]|nr:GNAT family N-acetyltransferase [Bacteroidota bacterium]